ncbi:hypothetical protein E0H73_36625 [Kribbella pittospori]|uniref:Uncharacterized protein n=1 Tax=Kribbella pittospori TaxID=722689 RepID=A0A4R0K683_9ACTN|nr:hypothetical protein E0H73_36625 [Kribbella pittospori]
MADRGIRQLRRELVEHEFETRAVQQSAPEGSKGDPATVGTIAVALGGAGGAVSVLMAVLKDWLGRRSGSQAIKLTIGEDSIELDRATAGERQQLIEAFLRKHESS